MSYQSDLKLQQQRGNKTEAEKEADRENTRTLLFADYTYTVPPLEDMADIPTEAARTSAPDEPAQAAPAAPHHLETASQASPTWSPSQELVRDLVETCQQLLAQHLLDHPTRQSEVAPRFDRLARHARILDSSASESAPQSASSQTESEPSQSATEAEIRAELSQIFWIEQNRSADQTCAQIRESRDFLAQKGIHV